MKIPLIERTTEVTLSSFQRRLSQFADSGFLDSDYVIYAVGNTYKKQKNITLENNKWEFKLFFINGGLFVKRPNYFVAKIKDIKYTRDFFEHVLDYLLIEFVAFKKGEEQEFLKRYLSYSNMNHHVDDFKNSPYVVLGVDTDPTDVDAPDNILQFVSYSENAPKELLYWL